MEYWIIPPSIIYVWKEGRPEKPVVATKTVKNTFVSRKSK
jgi:hypothetical protein